MKRILIAQFDGNKSVCNQHAFKNFASANELNSFLFIER